MPEGHCLCAKDMADCPDCKAWCLTLCPHGIEPDGGCVSCNYPDAYWAACLICDAGKSGWGWFNDGICLRCKGATEGERK